MIIESSVRKFLIFFPNELKGFSREKRRRFFEEDGSCIAHVEKSFARCEETGLRFIVYRVRGRRALRYLNVVATNFDEAKRQFVHEMRLMPLEDE